LSIKTLLANIDQLQKTIDTFRPFSETTLKSLKEYYRIELTYTSNALEGNSLTESETKIVIEEGLTIAGKPLRDHLEAAGHSKAYDFMFTLINKKGFTEADVMQLHALFYGAIDVVCAGTYRTDQVFISGSAYPLLAPEKVALLMQQFIARLDELRTNCHPVEYAALVHKEFVFIHPFIDGNGRVARLLMNLTLLQEHYFIALIPPVVRSDYIRTLEMAHTNDDDFKVFIARMVYETQKDIIRLLQG